MKLTKEDIDQLQSLDLEIKEQKSINRIIDAIMRFGVDGLYVSVSGGKDSQVLEDLVKRALRSLDIHEKAIPTVFCDTGLEWDSVREIGLKADVVIKPKLSFLEILKKYGYPVISKEQSQFINEYRRTKSEKLKKLRVEGNESGRGKISKVWFPIVDADFMPSHKCCYWMKKHPFEQYEKKTGRIPILGIMADDSNLRYQGYLDTGCNAFDRKRPMSKPLGPWLYQNILEYVVKYNINIAEVYGEIYQIDLFGKLGLTGVRSTGCIFCMFGCQRNNFHKFDVMKKIDPKKYDYCMNGGKYDVADGLWKPHKGLGLRKIIDYIRTLM